MIPPGQRRADTSGQSTRSLAADKLLQALNASPHRRLCREPRRRPDRCLFAVHTWHETDMPKDLGDVRCWVNSGKHVLALSFSGFDPGCVKTCTSRECAELFSLFSSFDGDCQSGSFVIQRNRDKLSARKFDVGVFTQPG